jgi:hypothetical protein
MPQLRGNEPILGLNTNMTERGVVQERLRQLMELEEGLILVGFHQEV